MTKDAPDWNASIWHQPSGAKTWNVPSLDDGAGPGTRSQTTHAPKPPTAQEIAAIQQAAREEGFHQGRNEGLASGRAEANAELAALRSIAAQLSRPLAELDTEVERALTNLALSMARRIVGQAVEDEVENLRQLVHRVVSHLGALESEVEVELSPEDYQRLNALDDLDGLWKLRSNPELQAGDVVVRQEDTEVDGRLMSRIQSLAADMLDGS